MQVSNYTSENIARALGLDGFANDWQLAAADEAIRFLILPSFHPELCISFLKREDEYTVVVVAAREQIWQQGDLMPKPTATLTSEAAIPVSLFRDIATSLHHAAESERRHICIADGMRVHVVHRSHRRGQLNINEPVGEREEYTTCVRQALTVAWQRISDPLLRNAVSGAASYTGADLPAEIIPPVKPQLRTVILGPDDISANLLDGLKRHHE